MTELDALRNQMRALHKSSDTTTTTTTTTSAEMDALRRELQTLREDYTNDMADLRTALRKQKGEWVRQLNDALSKIAQQSQTIAAQQVEIDALKRKVSSGGSGSSSKSTLEASSNSLNSQSLGKSKKKNALNQNSFNNNNNDDHDDSSDHSCELPGLYGHLHHSPINTKPKRGRNNNNDNDDTNSFYSKASESFMHDSFRPMEDDLLDEGNGDVELEFDFDLTPMMGDNDDDNDNNNNTTTVPNPGGRKLNRRGSLDSVQTIDLEEPRKKVISLLPHKSVHIYNEQRADTALRKLIVRGKSQNISVRKVHGKNLVFFHDRIYIPAGLRQKTLEYYYKKYRKQTPILHLEKNCYWPDMELDMRKYENKVTGNNWKVRIS